MDLKTVYYNLLSGAKKGLSAIANTLPPVSAYNAAKKVIPKAQTFIQQNPTSPISTGLAGLQSKIPMEAQYFSQQAVRAQAPGLMKAWLPPPTTTTQKLAGGVGTIAGFVNPFNPANKVLGVTGGIGARAVSGVAPRLVGKAVSPLLTKVATKAVPAIGAELAQTGLYTGAQALAGQPLTPVANLAYGLGARGAFSGAGNVLRTGFTNADVPRFDLTYKIKGVTKTLSDLDNLEMAGWTKHLNEQKIPYKVSGIKPIKKILPGSLGIVAKDQATSSVDTTAPQVQAARRIKQQASQLQTQSRQSQRIIAPDLDNDVKQVEKAIGEKVNLLDWIRTPDRVLKKIGLEKEAGVIRDSYNKYLDELPIEIDKITQWYRRVGGDKTASQRIFKYLDGQEVKLNTNEQKVAGEIQTYLKEWADKLGLPEDRRIANYITHIFEKDFIKKDFDEDLAKIIADKVPGSVYDPFLQERLGKQGYVEDVFRALDAYTKRAVRKYNMDPALEMLKKSSEKLPLESWNYVKSYADRINLRPTQIDNYLDNLVKQTPVGYRLGARPTTAVSRGMRRAVYRGTLGLNVGSALRNLTQGVNTYAKLGEKYTGIGYIKAFKEMIQGGDELTRSGVLRDNFIQDRQLSAVKGVMEKLDKGLWVFFNFAEKVNRGSAYFGAKAKYLAQGLSEEEAVKKAVALVRDTQFTFGSVDTPVALQSDLVKTFTQFQSFNVKQTEFLAEMVKNKEIAGLVRWTAGNLLMMATIGQLIGIDLEDIIPFGGVMTGQTKLGATPPIQAITDLYKATINAPDKYGNVSEDNTLTRVGEAVKKNAPAFIPAGVQIKKTVEGLGTVGKGYSETASGRVRFPVQQTPSNYVRSGLFGQYNLPEAREYYDNKRSVLGEKQSETLKQSDDKMGEYQKVLDAREQNKAIEAAKKEMETKPGVKQIGDTVIYTENGEAKTFKINAMPELPQYTGNIELDKKLKSSYSSKLTAVANDIAKLYELGQISAADAEAALRQIEGARIKTGTKKAKKISLKIPKLKFPKLKKASFKIKKVRRPKQYKLKKIKLTKVVIKRRLT